MTVARYQTAIDGSNPFVLDGPTVSLQGGTILPQFKPGHVGYGDCESEFVYCKLVLGSATTLVPGQAYTWDDDYTATLLSTSSLLGLPVGVSLVSAPASAQAAAGTYYFWLLRAGQAPIRNTAITNINAQVETTATAGAVLSKTAQTTGSKALAPGISFTKTIPTFTADVTNGSKILVNPSIGAAIFDSGPFIGAVLSGTGLAASQVIEYIYNNAPGFPGISIVLSANATVTNTGVTITPTLVGEGRVRWPIVGITGP